MHMYRADFWPTAGSGNRTNFAPGRLVIAPGGLGAPLGINLAWFAPKTLILNWLALRGLHRAMLLGPPKGPRSERTRRLRNSNWQAPHLAGASVLDPFGRESSIFAEILISPATWHPLKGRKVACWRSVYNFRFYDR